jgi:hypothetical protein
MNTQALGQKNLVKKITFKSVVGKPDMQIVEVPNVDNPDKMDKVARAVRKEYMRVYGSVSKIATMSTDYGDSVKFIGDFRAINLETGEQFSGGELFLPTTAEIFLSNFIKGLGDEFTSVAFAFDVGVKPANTTVGYEYTVKPLIEQDEEKDPLAAMFKTLPPLPGKIGALLNLPKTEELTQEPEIKPEEKPEELPTLVIEPEQKPTDKKKK